MQTGEITNPELQNRVHILWDELADINASKSKQAANHLMGRLCGLIHAQNAIWFGTVRLDDADHDGPMKGWRLPVFHYLHPNQRLESVSEEQVKRMDTGAALDPTILANMAGAGRFRANRLCDLAPEEWFQSSFYQSWYRDSGQEDAVYIGFPVNQDAESWFGFFREIGFPRFSETERDTLAYALRGIKWFHRQLMLSHGLLVANEPLSPAERRVLRYMLSGLPEKEIGSI